MKIVCMFCEIIIGFDERLTMLGHGLCLECAKIHFPEESKAVLV